MSCAFTDQTLKVVHPLVSVFEQRCVIALETIGDKASKVDNRDEALRAYSIALSLGPPSPNHLLFKWVGLMLLLGSPKETLDAASNVCSISCLNYGS